MLRIQDLLQWDRFITPNIIKSFYWLVIALVVLGGISGIFAGLLQMAISPFGGCITALTAIAGMVAGVVFSRIIAELILIAFRMNEHLGAIRQQVQGGQPYESQQYEERQYSAQHTAPQRQDDERYYDERQDDEHSYSQPQTY